MKAVAEARESLRRAVFPRSRRGRWRRTKVLRVCSALLAATAVWVVAGPVLRSAGVVPAPAGVSVVVAVREVPVGTALSGADVRLESRQAGQSPESAVGSLADAVGKVTAGPVGPGEVVTSYRLQGPDQLAGLPSGRLAVAAPVTDPALLASIHPGDTVTLLAPGTGQAVADRVVVLTVVREAGDAVMSSSERGGHLVVALTREQAGALAVASGSATGGGAGFVVALSG